MNFFPTLKRAGVQKLLDVRRFNTAQVLGFNKKLDLKYFLEECFGIAYEHVLDFAPSPELLKEYQTRLGKKKKDDAAWADYVERFQNEVLSQPIIERFKRATQGFDTICLLCSEETPDRCHRRLLADYFGSHIKNLEVSHL
jgi:uncharacterized protein (DUF488 family)